MITTALRFAYRELIHNRRNQIPFWILVGFLPTFIFTRLLVASNPELFLVVRGIHVHHFTYGFFVLAIVGFLSLVWQKPSRTGLAIAYGFGLALAFDEFGMWLKLADEYNLDTSQDVMVGITAALVFLTYGIGIIRRAIPHMRRLDPRRRG